MRLKKKVQHRKNYYKQKDRKVQANFWKLTYDPYLHLSEDDPSREEKFLNSYPEGCMWDLYNIRETMKYFGFHEGMIFKNVQTGTVRTIVKDDKEGLKFLIETEQKEVKSAQI